MNEIRTYTEGIPHPEPELNPVGALEGGVQGKTRSRARVDVCIVRCSTRSLDPDNLRGSVKAIVDCLRYAGLIADDTEAHISLDVSQMQVSRRKDHKTLITLTYNER